MMNEFRLLGRAGAAVSPIGIGCWTIGGLAKKGDSEHGWSGTDDTESVRAVHRALDIGVNFIDTADVYGAGHSESLLGNALAGRREIFISTKFGKIYDENTRARFDDTNVEPAYIRSACEASLRRLRIEAIDLYFLHEPDIETNRIEPVIEVLEELVSVGKIKSYGWSTDDYERALAFSRAPRCAAIQHRLNIFEGNLKILELCETKGMASINRSPLGQGLLTGKFSADAQFGGHDVRAGWNLSRGTKADQLRALEKIKALLTSDGRSLAQGALGWLLAKSQSTVPIPGFKTVTQVEDNVGALRFGPLATGTMAAIDKLVSDFLNPSTHHVASGVAPLF